MPAQLAAALDRWHLAHLVRHPAHLVRCLEHPARFVRPEQSLVQLVPREQLPERSVRPAHRGQQEQRDR